MSLSESGFERKTKRAGKSEFLEEMSPVVDWATLVSLIAPHAPVPCARGGCPPFAIATMLSIHVPQQWFSPSGPAMKDALEDMALFHAFVGLDAGDYNLPDGCTVLQLYQLRQVHNLSLQTHATVNATLEAKRLQLERGAEDDVKLIPTPNSTKNSGGVRDPDMHQTKKRNLWHFGMKHQIGVSADAGQVHPLVNTAANVNDMTHALVHVEEADVFADSGDQGVGKRNKTQGVEVNRHLAMRSHKRKVLDKSELMGAIMDQLKQVKTRIGAKVEHPFQVIKRQFRDMNVRYRAPAQGYRSAVNAVCAAQPVDRAADVIAGDAGMSAFKCRQKDPKRIDIDVPTDLATPNSLPTEIKCINSNRSGCSAYLP